jgi:hypothetical protein
MSPSECCKEDHDVDCAISMDAGEVICSTRLFVGVASEQKLFNTYYTISFDVKTDGSWKEYYREVLAELGYENTIAKGLLHASLMLKQVVLHIIATRYKRSSKHLWGAQSIFEPEFIEVAYDPSENILFVPEGGAVSALLQLKERCIEHRRFVRPKQVDLHKLTSMELVYAGHDMHNAELVWFSDDESNMYPQLSGGNLSGPLMNLRLQTIVMAFSDSHIWSEARTEWITVCAYEVLEDTKKVRCQCTNSICKVFVITHRSNPGRVLGPIGSSCIEQIAGEVDEAGHNAQLLASLRGRMCDICEVPFKPKMRKCEVHFNNVTCSRRWCSNMTWESKDESKQKGKHKDTSCESCRTCPVCGVIMPRGFAFQRWCSSHENVKKCEREACKRYVCTKGSDSAVRCEDCVGLCKHCSQTPGKYTFGPQKGEYYPTCFGCKSKGSNKRQREGWTFDVDFG